MKIDRPGASLGKSSTTDQRNPDESGRRRGRESPGGCRHTPGGRHRLAELFLPPPHETRTVTICMHGINGYFVMLL